MTRVVVCKRCGDLWVDRASCGSCGGQETRVVSVIQTTHGAKDRLSRTTVQVDGGTVVLTVQGILRNVRIPLDELLEAIQ